MRGTLQLSEILTFISLSYQDFHLCVGIIFDTDRAFGFILFLLAAELPLVMESFVLLNDIFPFPSILDADCPVFNLHLANILFDVWK